jgi:hypothetical protein
MKKAIVIAITLGVFGFYFAQFETAGLDYWDTYIVAPATFVAGRPCEFIDENDQPAYSYDLKRSLPDDLLGRDSYGIVSKDQRIGAGVTASVMYLAFGVLGFRLFYALFGAMAFLFAYLAGKRLFKGDLLPIAVGLIVAVNPFMISMNRLNANFISVTILAALVALILDKNPRWWVIGLVYGALGGIRNEAIMIAPALLVYLLGTRTGRRGFPGFFVGALAGISPYLAWNKFAFGKALIHASQFSEFEGWRPMFDHEIFGWHFEINGLFNWPFHDTLVRTPHYPYPTYITIPLVLILCFGVVLIASALIGLYAQWIKDKKFFAFSFIWLTLCLGLFLFQENWEEPKTTFAALIIPPLAFFMGACWEWMAAEPRNLKRWSTLVIAVLVLEAFVFAAKFIRVPVDERWYVRFPKSKVEAAFVGCLEDEQRREWMFFHTDECFWELSEQRAKLTRGNLVPRPYYPIRFHLDDAQGKWGLYRPPIFDIWEKIYGH